MGLEALVSLREACDRVFMSWVVSYGGGSLRTLLLAVI